MKYPIQVLFREYFEGILAAVFLALFLRFFVVNVLYVPTENMQPSLMRGDFVMGWRLAYGFPMPLMKGERLNAKLPNRGDLISFRFPGDEEQILIRRVVGLPGDTIMIEGGTVKVNDAILKQTLSGEVTLEQPAGGGDPYSVINNLGATLKAVTVPKGRLFVLSDNRNRSDDSRDWGFVPMNNVESRISLIWLSVDSSQEGIDVVWPRILSWVR